MIYRFALIFFCLTAVASSLAQDRGRSVVPEPQYTSEGTERCLACHGGEAMSVMAETPHGNLDNPLSPFSMEGCEACHGPGSIHISRARGGAGFPPLLGFHVREATADPENVDQDALMAMTSACTRCHSENMGDLEGIDWFGSVHAENNVTCVNCHSRLHSLEKPMADRKDQLETCNACHRDAIASHRTFEDRGIVFDRLTCYDCHDVHQLIGAE